MDHFHKTMRLKNAAFLESFWLAPAPNGRHCCTICSAIRVLCRRPLNSSRSLSAESCMLNCDFAARRPGRRRNLEPTVHCTACCLPTLLDRVHNRWKARFRSADSGGYRTRLQMRTCNAKMPSASKGERQSVGCLLNSV